MSNPVSAYSIRAEIELMDFAQPFKNIASGQTPRIPSGNDVVFQCLLRLNGELPDVSTISALEAVILSADRTAQYGSAITITTPLDGTVDEDNWADGTKQHFTINLSSTATELAASVDGTEYCLMIYGTADGKSRALGWTQLFVVLDGVPTSAPELSPNNLVPNGATYDGSGHYTLSGLTTGKLYMWTDGGSHDTSVTNGTETVTTSNNFFVAQGTSVTLNGTAGQSVTALVRMGANLVSIPATTGFTFDYIWVKNPDDSKYYKCRPRTVEGTLTWTIDENSGTLTPS